MKFSTERLGGFARANRRADQHPSGIGQMPLQPFGNVRGLLAPLAGQPALEIGLVFAFCAHAIGVAPQYQVHRRNLRLPDDIRVTGKLS